MSLIASCFAGPVLRRFAAGWWADYKARHARDVVSMRLQGERWHQAGLIHNVERGIALVSYFGLACGALGVVGAVYGALK
jgi:hypothetical protein